MPWASGPWSAPASSPFWATPGAIAGSTVWLSFLIGAILPGGDHLAENSPMLLLWIAAFFVLTLAIEIALNRLTTRSVKTRCDGEEAQ
ncbi:hypothetical protein [Pelagibius marinus]|uniref:hypothetical protein n=1 Tax=Pelagibius marinus TaxID=2762760 RepID=UPI00187229CE|nr:hypothetical protein [Pelagibius marinus]